MKVKCNTAVNGLVVGGVYEVLLINPFNVCVINKTGKKVYVDRIYVDEVE